MAKKPTSPKSGAGPAKAPAKSAGKPSAASATKPRAGNASSSAGSRAADVIASQNASPPQPAFIPHPAPVPLARILGQPRALATISAALSADRVHHAWIFHGPSGVGKLTTALAFAALLLDPTSQPNFGGEWEADPEGRVQKLLSAGTHPDLQVVVKELARFSRDTKTRAAKLQNIPKEVILEFFIEPATRTSAVSAGARAGKVFIIDEAELLDATSQNAILKTLEEPPPGTVLILVTSSEDGLLPTIRSRCQRVPFAPLNDYAMRDWLKSSGLEPPAEQLAWLHAFAAGSPGAFKAALDGGLYAWHAAVAPLLEQVSRGQYALDLGPTMASLVDQWAKDFVAAHENASKEAANRAAADEMFRLVADHFRRGLRAAPKNAAVTAGAFDAVSAAESRLNANVDLKFVFEGLSADLSAVFA